MMMGGRLEANVEEDLFKVHKCTLLHSYIYNITAFTSVCVCAYVSVCIGSSTARLHAEGSG